MATGRGTWLVVLAAMACGGGQGNYDIVLANGRVMDPESGLDAVRHVGITGGRIAAVSSRPLAGAQVVDVTAMVVAPGFIDLHAHGQDVRSNQLQAQDGVTTALDMEDGSFPVADWYASREGQAVIHYGGTVGHIPARIFLKHGIEIGNINTSARMKEATGHRAWAFERASSEEVDRVLALLARGLDEGALGIGIAVTYTPGVGREEVHRIFELAASRSAGVYAHVRSAGEREPGSSLEAVQEVVANAVTTGAPLHIVHITSSGMRQTPLIMDMIAGARRAGTDITTEAYPYTAWSTAIESALFEPGWDVQYGISYGDLQWVATGERLTRESFRRYRRQGGLVIGHAIPREVADFAVAHPMVIIASDGLPFVTGGEHPRGAGTFARVLGYYSREEQALSLMDALRKMTIMPARRLEPYVPQMRTKGRIQVGADADITVFDPALVIDRATFENSTQPSDGIELVLVAGTFVVKDGLLVPGVYPGKPIRRSND